MGEEQTQKTHDPKHTTPSVKRGGGSVMAWICMVANRTGSLVFSNYVTVDRCSKINCIEVYFLLKFSPANAAKMIGWHFTAYRDNDPNIPQKQPKFLGQRKGILFNGKSSDRNVFEHAFHWLKTKLKAYVHTVNRWLKNTCVYKIIIIFKTMLVCPIAFAWSLEKK